MTITDREFALLVRRSLERGVPSGVVADIFGLDKALVGDMQREVHVTMYGTDDQAEYLENIQWAVLDKAHWMIQHGSAAEAVAMARSVFGKQLSLAGKRTPEHQQAKIDELEEVMREMREGAPSASGEASPFVVTGAVEDA